MTTIKDAYRRFSRTRFPLPTEEAVAALEEQIGVTFPPDYRDYILQYNGGYFTEPDIIPPPHDDCPADCLTFMRGIGAARPSDELGRKQDINIFDDNDPPEVVPIGSTIMGHLILLVTHPEDRGMIVLRTFTKSFFLAYGIEEFFGLLHEPLDD